MAYEAELSFFTKLMKNYNIHVHRFAPSETPEVDMGLRRLLGLTDISAARDELAHIASNVLFTALDSFGCCYCACRLPEDGDMLLIGPFLRQEMTESAIMTLLERHHLPVTLLPTLRQYYATITYVEHDGILLPLLTTLGEVLWGSTDAFSMEYMESVDRLQLSPDAQEAGEHLTEAADIQLLEKRYDAERRLMYAVSHGQIHQAQLLISHAHENLLEHRVPDLMRSLRNYGIVLNTLLRKAAEHGTVHPVHIDKLSSSMARKLETVRTPDEMFQQYSTMVHKYCLLVKNHSMQHYSQLVQHVILRIEADLTADLSLSTHAAELNVNPSYLSTLFKRETGLTLTEFVNRQRIDHAIFLFNTTDMQVQTIAQHCGIPDVNYFTKTFKRMIGKTPKEYRQDTRRMVVEH